MSLPMKLVVAVPTACLYEMDGGMELVEFYEQHVPEKAVKPVNLKCEDEFGAYSVRIWTPSPIP